MHETHSSNPRWLGRRTGGSGGGGGAERGRSGSGFCEPSDVVDPPEDEKDDSGDDADETELFDESGSGDPPGACLRCPTSSVPSEA